MGMNDFSKLKADNPTDSILIDKVKSATKEMVLATIMVTNCTQKLYSNIDDNLRMDFAKGMDNMPTNVSDAQETLNQFRRSKNRNQPSHQPPRHPPPHHPPKKDDKFFDKPKTDAAPDATPKRSVAHQLLLKGGDDIYSGNGAGFCFTQVVKPKFSLIFNQGLR